MSEKVFLPTLDESVAALHVSTWVRDLVDEFAATGKCESSTLIALGAALFELENKVLGAGPICERWEELQDLLPHRDAHPELSTYANLYVEFEGPDDTGVVHRFERDPATEEIV